MCASLVNVMFCYGRQCVNALSLDFYFQEFFEDGFVKKATLEKGVHVLKAAVRLYRQTTDGLVSDFMRNFASAHGEGTRHFLVPLLAFILLSLYVFVLCAYVYV